MVKLSIISILFLIPNFAFAQNLDTKISHFQNLFNNPRNSTTISNSDYNVGETRPKAILKGVFYIGGSDRRRELLSSGFLNKICSDDFSRVYSVYKKVDNKVSCSGRSLSYQHIGEARDGGGGRRVYDLFSYLYEQVINGPEGAVFLHCHYGVHASNTIAQMALMQFCGISKSQAKQNWDEIDLYNSLGAKGRARQFEKIDEFSPYGEFQISESQKNKICH